MVFPSFAEFEARALAARDRFLRDLEHASEVQERLLLEECIAPNVDTAFGREHGFKSIRSSADFRQAVPIRSYDELSPWFERSAAGEESVLTAAPPIAFGRTSGTTGAAKKVPCTRHFQDAHEQRRFYTNFGNLLAHHPEAVEAPDSTWDLTWVWGGPPSASRTVGGFLWTSVADRLTSPAVLEAEGIPLPGNGAPWTRPPDELTDRTERQYWCVRTAVERDPRAIISINPSTLLSIAQVLAESTERLVREVADGTVLGRRVAAPNPTRAAELARLAEVASVLEPHSVWPRVSVIECWTAGSCALYLPRVKNAFGREIEFLNRGISGTEGPIAIPVDRHPTSCPLYVCSAFLEFLPVDDGDAAVALTCEALETGRSYEVVLTQPSGLYRYALGDVVRVVGWYGGVPRVEFSGRRAVTSSFTGEKLTEPQVVAAAASALRSTGIVVSGVTCCPVWGDPPHYAFVVETELTMTRQSIDQLAASIDAALGEHNDEYPSKRATRRLGPVTVHPVAPGTFARRRDRLVAAGTSAVQVKDKALQDDAAALMDLLTSGGVIVEER